MKHEPTDADYKNRCDACRGTGRLRTPERKLLACPYCEGTGRRFLRVVGGTPIRLSIIQSYPEPKCPACGAGVDRPKCLFEMGGDCPRHEIRSSWKSRMLRAEQGERESNAGDIPMETAR